MVAQPLHGLCPPVHVLLRPRLRAAGGPTRWRGIRPDDPRQGQHRARAATRAGAARVAARDGDDRGGHRSVPAGRGPLSTDPRLSRGPRRRAHAVQHRHARPPDRARHRRPHRGGAAGRRRRERLHSHPGRGGLASHRTRYGFAAPAAPRRADARGGRHQDRHRHGAHPARPLRSPRAAAGGGPRRAGGRGQPTSGPTSSTCVRAPASTSSITWPATGRRSARATSGSSPAARTCPGATPRRSWGKSLGCARPPVSPIGTSLPSPPLPSPSNSRCSEREPSRWRARAGPPEPLALIERCPSLAFTVTRARPARAAWAACGAETPRSGSRNFRASPAGSC